MVTVDLQLALTKIMETRHKGIQFEDTENATQNTN